MPALRISAPIPVSGQRRCRLGRLLDPLQGRRGADLRRRHDHGGAIDRRGDDLHRRRIVRRVGIVARRIVGIAEGVVVGPGAPRWYDRNRRRRTPDGWRGQRPRRWRRQIRGRPRRGRWRIGGRARRRGRHIRRRPGYGRRLGWRRRYGRRGWQGSGRTHALRITIAITRPSRAARRRWWRGWWRELRQCRQDQGAAQYQAREDFQGFHGHDG